MIYNKALFVKMIPKIQTDGYEESLKRLYENESVLDTLKQQKAELDVMIENDKLLESKQLNVLYSEEKVLKEKVNQSLIDISKSEFSVALFELASKKDERFYESLKKADQYIESITSDEKAILESNLQLLKSLGKAYFGVASVAVLASKESITDSIDYIDALLHKPLFVFNEKAVTSADILQVLLIFVIGLFLASFYRRRILKWSLLWVNATQMTAKVIANFGYYFIILITFLMAINSVGIDLTSFSMFASALAIGVGFGLQTVVSNMVAGIIMMFERSVRVGDFVELSDTLRGTVTDMRIRSTVIKTLDNIDIVVPNSSFIQNNVINLTLDDTMRRLHIPFGVAYGTKVERVNEVILNELEQSDLLYYRGDNKDRLPIVRMIGMGASSVDYELLVWIDWNYKKGISTKSDFLILIYNALYKHHIEIPFPQLDLHVKSMDQSSQNITKS
jgi:small-conductance mechanosensitive channel